MSSDDYLEIPESLLGSWNYNQPILLGVATLQSNLLIEYAPSSMYELLNIKNPYNDDTAQFKLFVYSLRVSVLLLGTTQKDTLWLGPFVGYLSEDGGKKKLNIITKFPDTDEPTKNGWSIIPAIVVSDNGFDEEGVMSIYKGLSLNYRDIYSSRFIIPYFDEDKKELTLKVRVLCDGECPSKIEDKEYDDSDNHWYAIFEGTGTKGCLDYNSNISDCLPSCKYAATGDFTVEIVGGLTWRVVAVISSAVLIIIILVFLIKLIRKLIKR